MYSKSKDALYNGLKIFVTVVLLAMVMMIFINAVLRYAFHSGISATEELSRYAFVWVSALGAILGYYADKHVGVDLLVNSLHGMKKLVVQIIAELIVLGVLYILISGGWRYFIQTYNLDSAAIAIPMGLITVTPVLMGITMLPKTLMLVRDHITEYRRYRDNEGKVDNR